MDAVLGATQRMNTLIVSLLDLSALEAGAAKLNEERFDFVELVETVAGRLLIDTPEETYDFTYELPEECVFIYADKRRMEQVLNNLIENARQHARARGNIKLSINCHGQSVYFSVWNEGDAIEEADLPKIWTKFYRGQSRKRNGSGLGLSIVAQVLSMYRAPYGVKNKGGVEFYFWFNINLK